MNTINNNNVNFEANRIMIARNTVSKKKKDIVEIFRLTKDDIDFVKDKYDKIPEKAGFTSAQGRIKNFLRQFIEEKKGFSWASLEKNEYYIAIKNHKKLVGAMRMKPSFDRVILKDVIETNKQDSLTKKGLFMSFLQESRNKKGDIVGVPHLIDSFKQNKNFINRSEINNTENNIKALSPNINFEKIDNEEVNLLYYLG